MCGIAGIISLANVSAGGKTRTAESDGLAASLRRMITGLRHRGPDDEGSIVCRMGEGTVFLGHTRLSILDLSAAGHQPMSDGAEGCVQITFNGEIYNFKDLRERLGTSGGQWRTQTDTEVILRAYEEWGVKAFQRFRGMFAFGAWDTRNEQMVLARDSFGIKPLYYCHTAGQFVFASELKALLASGLVAKEICPDGLASYLSYGSVEAPFTIIKGVRMLRPGCYLTVKRRGDKLALKEEPYSAEMYLQHKDDIPATRRDAVVQLRQILEDSVRQHLVSDVPVGAFLSGGIDSSAIVGLMSRVSSERPRTFSVVFAEKEFCEAEFSRLISREFNTEHQEVRLSESELLALLPQALTDMDHPTTDGVNTYVVAKAVHEAGIKVALSGLGGDELFAGYPSFRRALLLKRLLALPGGVRKVTANIGSALLHHSVKARKTWEMFGGEMSPRKAYTISRQIFSPREVAVLTGRPLASDVRSNGDFSRPEARDEDYINAVSRLELEGYMANTLLRDTDQMSMAHSLEVRVPFVDLAVVPYVMNLPGRWKVDGQRPKPLLLDAVSDLLPEKIWRRRKMGFTLPFERWMRSSLSPELDETFASGSVLKDAHGGCFAQQVWDDFKNHGRRERWSRPWALHVLNAWCALNGVGQ